MSRHGVAQNTVTVALAIILVHFIPISASAVLYVDGAATGSNTGLDWANAYTHLESALNSAAKDTEIWVAKGTYKPGAPGADRGKSFLISDRNVAVYGGFTNGMAARANRNPVRFPTILSGDLSGDDGPNWANRGDNAYHVLGVGSASVLPTGDVVDGFIIRGGNADASDVLNFASYGGGLAASNSSALVVANCVFTDNSASGGGGLWLRRFTGATVANCIFSGNRASLVSAHNFGSGAAGVAAQAGTYAARFSNCRFTGNTSAEYGGVYYSSIYLFTNSFWNCLIVGNVAGEGGGGLHIRNYTADVFNCTFSGNFPCAIYVQNVANPATNCILWNDTAEINKANAASKFFPGYSDIMDATYSGISSNISLDPKFLIATDGTWTADAVYNPLTAQTQLTDGHAQWPFGRLAGGTVNPNASQNLQFYIATNTTTSVFVWGDASTLGVNGATYGLYDWHLSSNSPCVDTGDPSMSYTNELDYPQGRIDMGAYGNTREAFSTNPPPRFDVEFPSGLTIFVR